MRLQDFETKQVRLARICQVWVYINLFSVIVVNLNILSLNFIFIYIYIYDYVKKYKKKGIDKATCQ